MFKVLDQVAHKEYDEVFYIFDEFQNCFLGQCYSLRSASGLYLKEVEESKLSYIRSTPKKDKYEYLAMYIIVKDTVPTGLGINACSHAGFLAARNFKGPIMSDWEKYSFRKRTCLVTPEQFDECVKTIDEVNGEYVLFRENDWHDEIISAAFAPRYSFPQIFKDIKLHPGHKL